MYTVIAYSESQDPNSVMVNVAAVEDQHVRVSGDKIYIGNLNKLIGAYACVGATGIEARLVSPSLRRVNPFYISPVDLAITPPADPALFWRGESPVSLDTNEALEAQNNAATAAAEYKTILVFLSDGVQSPLNGEIMTINATVTLALLAGEWAYSEITFPESLPVGMYSVVGARCIAAAAVGFRFVPIGAVNRPGGVCAALVNSKDPYNQRLGRLGEWFQFEQINPPGLEIISSAAAGSATYDIMLDVIKI